MEALTVSRKRHVDEGVRQRYCCNGGPGADKLEEATETMYGLHNRG